MRKGGRVPPLLFMVRRVLAGTPAGGAPLAAAQHDPGAFMG